MGKKYLNYVGNIVIDSEYHALGEPKDYIEVRVDVDLPFRLYCSSHEEDWEEVSEEERSKLISELKDKKIKYSKSDYRYYIIDFHLASLGAL